VAQYAQAHGVIDVHAVALAVSEAVTNAVVHAYSDAALLGDVEIFAQRHLDDGLEVVVSDYGHGLLPRPDSPGMGVGLPLLATLADHFEIERGDSGGTRVRMTFAAA
jgi:serine/threonine-protein kinase RsbW/stage II sporulation protein AB (anti-sigma F factor)